MFEDTFLQLQVKVIDEEFVKDSMNAFSVELQVVMCCDEHIIHVDDKPSFSEFFFKDGIHHHLECCWGVSHSKKHHCWFKQSFVHDEGCFPLIPISYPNVIVSPADVELGEQGSASRFIDELWDEW